MMDNSNSVSGSARLCTALFLSVMLGGCATMGLGSGKTGAYPRVSNTVFQACAAGVGFGILKVMFEDIVLEKKRRAEDYLKDGAIYGVAGCSVGYVVNKQRQQYATTAEYYDAEIASTRELNTEMKSVNTHLFSRTAANNQVLKKLKAEKESAEINESAARTARDTARADLSWAERQLENAQASLATQEAVLTEDNSELTGERKASLQKEVTQLAAYVDELEKEVGFMNNINDALVKL